MPPVDGSDQYSMFEDMDDDIFVGSDSTSAPPTYSTITYSQSVNFLPVISEYIKYVTTLNQVNEGNAPLYLSKINAGFAQVIYFQAEVQGQYMNARKERKATQARVALDDYPRYCRENDIKSTDKTRDFFIDQHKDVLKTVENEDKLYAKVTYLENIRTLFDRAIGSVRSIAYGRPSSSSIHGNHT